MNLATAPHTTGPGAVTDVGDLPLPSPAASQSPTAAVSGARQAPPVRLRIPRIGLDAALTDIQVQDDGHLGTPDDPDVAGWWSQGPAPGSIGAAVIVGHVDSRTGPAVFAGLSALRPGDTISVQSSDGTTTGFTVQALRGYAKDGFPSDLVFGATSGPSLRLITCSGSYDHGTGEYLANLVVFAVPTTPSAGAQTA
nr:class F sortase [Streptomyces sp. CB01881]